MYRWSARIAESNVIDIGYRWGAVAQSVEGATLGEVMGSIPAVAARSLLIRSVPYNVAAWDRSHGLPALSFVW